MFTTPDSSPRNVVAGRITPRDDRSLEEVSLGRLPLILRVAHFMIPGS